jgi:hypothetical protein
MLVRLSQTRYRWSRQSGHGMGSCGLEQLTRRRGGSVMCSLKATMYWVCAKVNASRGMAMKMPAITDLCARKENDEQTVRHNLHTGGPTPPRPPRLTQLHAMHCGAWPFAKTKWWHWQVLTADTTLFTTALRHSSRYPHSESRLHCLSSAQAPHAASRRRNSRGVHCDNERQCMQPLARCCILSHASPQVARSFT